MRVYLAAPSREMARARAAAATVMHRGHTLTSHWHEQDVPPSDAGVSAAWARAAWSENRDGIRAASRVIALANSTGGLSQGVREEVAYALGIADARGCLRVIIVGDPGPSLAAAGCEVVTTLVDALR